MQDGESNLVENCMGDPNRQEGPAAVLEGIECPMQEIPAGYTCYYTPVKHVAQNLWPIATFDNIVQWMVKSVRKDGERHLTSQTVTDFSQYFRGSTIANIAKATLQGPCGCRRRVLSMRTLLEKQNFGLQCHQSHAILNQA